MHAITGWAILIGIVLVIVFDLWMLWGYGVDYTISRWVKALGERWPLLQPLMAFGMGALYGHFFL